MKFKKTYYADSVEAAVAEAKRELGDDAYLLGSQATEGQLRARGAYEVCFETDGPAERIETNAAIRPKFSSPVTLTPREPSFAELKADLTRLTDLVSSLAARTAESMVPAEMLPVFAELSACDFPHQLLFSILDDVERAASRSRTASAALDFCVRQTWRAELGRRLRTSPGIGSGIPSCLALVGPAGAGKTTTLAKLAMGAAVAAKHPALIVTTDTYRVGAVEQLAAYAAIMGLPFEAAGNPAALKRLIAQHARKQIVLVDTPGLSPSEPELTAEVESMLAGLPELERQLVLPASTRTADLLRMAESFSLLEPSGLIFTRLDETRTPGGCVAVSLLTDLPISYVCTGQRIPEHIQAADKTLLLDFIFGEERRVMAHAA